MMQEIYEHIMSSIRGQRLPGRLEKLKIWEG